MRLSSLADYAVVVMAAAARHCGGPCLLGGARLNATLLAEQTGVPLPTAQKLVSRLAAAGLLESARGTGGGVRLARPAAAISLADIVEAVEGPIALTTCIDDDRHDCALDGRCSVKPHWGVVNEAIRGALSSVSLVQLATPLSSPAKAGAQLRAVSQEQASAHDNHPDWTPAFAGEVRF